MPDFLPGVDILIVMVALAGGVVIAFPEARHFPGISRIAATIGLLVLLIGPAAYTVSAMNTGFSSEDPSVTVPGSAQSGGPGGFGRDGGVGGSGDPNGGPNGGVGGPGAPGDGGAGSGATSATRQALYDYLLANRGSSSWIVAVQGAEQAATIEIATGAPVMAMGGFSGSDPTPTVGQLKAYVASGELRYVIVGGGGPGGGFGGPGGPGGPDGGLGGRGGSSDVTSWVTANGTLVTSISGVSLYDLANAV